MVLLIPITVFTRIQDKIFFFPISSGWGRGEPHLGFKYKPKVDGPEVKLELSSHMQEVIGRGADKGYGSSPSPSTAAFPATAVCRGMDLRQPATN